MPGTETLRRAPLHERHVAAGARLVPFAGWEMPVQYEGIRAEHTAVREAVGVFDVSHMGEIETSGRDAEAFLERILSNDVAGIAERGAQYAVLCNADGGVLDDLFTYRLEPDRFLTVTNASNHEKDLAWFHRHAAGFDVQVHDRRAAYAMLAVQGPQARELVGPLADQELPKRFRTVTATVAGAPGTLVAGTGYTGEDGVELHVPAAVAPACWRLLLDAAIRPAGLGARDTLRLEAGLPLHGHELGPGITPLQAGLSWVVRFDKGDFRGRGPLVAERDRGIHRRLRGLVLDGRQIPRTGYAVQIGEERVGEVTSGNFSPVLERGIALAFLRPDLDEGASVTVDIRGRPAAATVTRPPFVRGGRGDNPSN